MSALTPEVLRLRGPAGELEAVLEAPPQPRAIAVICHPHPLQGGTLHNKVVHTLARTLQELGHATLRFNYRGVGASAGSYGESIGEAEDARAAIGWMRSRFSDLPLTLAGFSFGGVVALRACADTVPARLITVAPAVDRLPMDQASPACPWLLVQGDADDVVAPQKVLDWAAAMRPPPLVRVLPGVGHFFHGALNPLQDAVRDWFQGP